MIMVIYSHVFNANFDHEWVGIKLEKCNKLCIEKTLIKYQLLNIGRVLTLQVLFYMNFHMSKTNAKVCKSLVLVFNICGERKVGAYLS
jgi:hypothetical protein